MFLDKIKQSFDLSVVKNIELEDMAIDFTGPDHWKSTLSSEHMIARLAHIPGFSWPIEQVRLRVIIQDQGVDIGKLESPYQPASVSGGIITSAISQSTMTVFENSHSAFSAFVAALATQVSHTFSIKGSADIVFHLGLLGTHSIKGVEFVSDLTLRGLNNLPEIKCVAITEVTPGDGYEVIIKAIFDIPNPSQLSLSLGDITLGLTTTVNVPPPHIGLRLKHSNADGLGDEDSEGEKGTVAEAEAEANEEQEAKQHTKNKQERHHPLGTIMFENLTLLQGMNDCRIGIIRMDTSLDGAKQFLKLVAQEPQTIHVKGFHGTSKNKALAVGLTSLTTSCVMPTFETPPLKAAPRIERE